MENIKILRDKTGAGMMDCNKALQEANGDIELAAEILRKKGITKAAKRDDREAKEGIVKVGVNADGTKGYIMEINSETDFVARNEKFQTFADQAFNLAVANDAKSLEELMGMQMADGHSVQENIDALSGIIGEKLSIKRFDTVAGGSVAAYSHMGSKMGVLVALSGAGKKDLAYDVAMQIAASNPRYICREEVASEELEKEKEIYREQLLKEGKPAEMLDKILVGKLNKFYEEICLVDQEYIKDDKQKVCNILGSEKVEKFVRYSL